MVSKLRPATRLQEIAANLHYHAGRRYLVFVDRCSKGAVQPHSSTRYLLVRWGPPVHFQVIQDFSIQWEFSYQMASPLSTQQWKGWGYCKAMKDHSSHMEWRIFRWETVQGLVAVSKHTIYKRQTVTSSEALRASHTGYYPSSPQILYIRGKTVQKWKAEENRHSITTIDDITHSFTIILTS